MNAVSELPNLMQTRDELYQRIDYYDYEQRLDAMFNKNK